MSARGKLICASQKDIYEWNLIVKPNVVYGQICVCCGSVLPLWIPLWNKGFFFFFFLFLDFTSLTWSTYSKHYFSCKYTDLTASTLVQPQALASAHSTELLSPSLCLFSGLKFVLHWISLWELVEIEVDNKPLCTAPSDSCFSCKVKVKCPKRVGPTTFHYTAGSPLDIEVHLFGEETRSWMCIGWLQCIYCIKESKYVFFCSPNDLW